MVEYQFKVPVAGEYAPPSTETPTLDTAKTIRSRSHNEDNVGHSVIIRWPSNCNR